VRREGNLLVVSAVDTRTGSVDEGVSLCVDMAEAGDGAVLIEAELGEKVSRDRVCIHDRIACRKVPGSMDQRAHPKDG